MPLFVFKRCVVVLGLTAETFCSGKHEALVFF